MFYKALGIVIWKLATAELRRRYAGRAKVLAVVGVSALWRRGPSWRRAPRTSNRRRTAPSPQ